MSRKQVEKTEQQLQQQRASILQSVDNIVIRKRETICYSI